MGASTSEGVSMSDNQDNKKEKTEDSKVQTQIQEKPIEIEKVESDGKKEEIQVVKSEEQPKEEVAAVPELSPEEQKKIEQEANRKKAKEILEKIRQEMRSGDTVKVFTKIKEGDKERIQAFQGVIISKKGRGISKTFIVRRISVDGVGVERIWPLFSPTIVKIEIMQKGKVRRSKLYYMRDRIGKAAMAVRKQV